MGDSSSFSSLFALVDNHLSKSNLQQDNSQPSTSGIGSFRLPPFNIQKGLSDTGLPSTSKRFPIPSLRPSPSDINDSLSKKFSNMYPSAPKDPTEDDEDSQDEPPTCMSDCPINDVLAIQLSNMFKAREAREEEERRKQEEMRQIEERLRKQKLEESSCLIDLMPAVQLPGQSRPIQPEQQVALSSSSSMESVVITDIPDVVEPAVEEPKRALATIPALDIVPSRSSSPKPIITDMSYILKHKIGKCSPFGKVLCARYRPVAAPYFRIVVPHKIKVFDFSTPSPDDIIMERLRKPSFYNNSNTTLSVYE